MNSTKILYILKYLKKLQVSTALPEKRYKWFTMRGRYRSRYQQHCLKKDINGSQ
jgi:hypothetical protein